MPEKCILEAFGTGVPARKVIVNVEFSNQNSARFWRTALASRPNNIDNSSI